MQVVKNNEETNQKEPEVIPVPPLVEYMRNAHIYGWPLSSTDVVAAYKKYPEHFKMEEREIAGRNAIVGDEKYEEYLAECMDAYQDCKENIIGLNPRINYKIEQKKHIMHHDQKLRDKLYARLKELKDQYFPKPIIEKNEVTENTPEPTEHS